MKDFREQNYYELLDVPVYAPPAEIESAYRRAAGTFNTDSVAVYALFPPEDLSLLRRRIDEAFAVLSDPERRRAYDQDLSIPPQEVTIESKPASVPPPEPPRSVPSPDHPVAAAPPAEIAVTPVPTEDKAARPEEVRPSPPLSPPPPEPTDPATAPAPAPVAPMPDIGPDAIFDGKTLKQIRQARGLSLEKVADITKINIYYLRIIEEENFSELPAQVYTRGYLRLLSAVLKLDPDRVVRSFLDCLKRATS